ncbi:cyanophycinase [uncultured Pseudoalteromonas sp.]|uniref:cyanophycinase n=1 Tax=uncultured Pseudoalteromonas sp. TaxID=114053 RepID=UPI002592F713|nr:cyanophycinase [uncultured Pseudoalteromonas sp.]
MNILKEQKTKYQTSAFSLVFGLFFASFGSKVYANDQQQTLVLVGGSLTTCSSMSPKNCLSNKQISGKQTNQYRLNNDALFAIKTNWPTKNKKNRQQTLKVLAQIAREKSGVITKSDILWAWRDLDNKLLNELTDFEYNFVIDSLEVAVLNTDSTRQKEQVSTSDNNDRAANDILDFVAASLKTTTESPTILAVTASSRDPYESADFYEGLLDFTGVESSWLPLTPALAKAITSKQCESLDSLRTDSMGVFNRETIYPDRIKAEKALCDKGVDHLVELIENATGIMFNGGDQSLTRKVLFDDNGKQYPWTHAILQRPLLVGTSAGTAVQSGGKNAYGTVPMISNGTSLAAMREGSFAVSAPSERCENECGDKISADSLTYEKQGGLGSFTYGVLDTHFSERNRTMRLARLLADTGQQHGFGIDETTALVSIRAGETALMTVIGNSGVVHVKSDAKNNGAISYWPAGAVIDVTKDGFNLAKRTVDNALPSIKIPPLPMQRFGTIFSDAKLRSLVQAMCLTQEQQAVAQHDEFLLDLNATDNTHYYRVNTSSTGCAVENLAFKVKTF